MIGLASAIYSLGQHFNLKAALGYQKERVIGTMGNPALYAGYMLFIVFISLYLFFYSIFRGIKNKFDIIGLACLDVVTSAWPTHPVAVDLRPQKDDADPRFGVGGGRIRH